MSDRFAKYRNQDDDDQSGWIVSYADLMSLLLGFFIIMFAFSSLDEKKFEQFSKELQAKFSGKQDNQILDPETLLDNERRQVRAIQLLATMLNFRTSDQMIEKIEDAAKSTDMTSALREKFNKVSEMSSVDSVRLESLTDREAVVEIVLPAQMLFGSGSDVLSSPAKVKLDEVWASLRKMHDVVSIEVRGHTDSLNPSDRAKFTSNWALSAARAGSVANYLISKGIDRKRITASGLADIKPLFPERNADGSLNPRNQAKNRRVEIVVKRRPEL